MSKEKMKLIEITQGSAVPLGRDYSGLITYTFYSLDSRGRRRTHYKYSFHKDHGWRDNRNEYAQVTAALVVRLITYHWSNAERGFYSFTSGRRIEMHDTPGRAHFKKVQDRKRVAP